MVSSMSVGNQILHRQHKHCSEKVQRSLVLYSSLNSCTLKNSLSEADNDYRRCAISECKPMPSVLGGGKCGNFGVGGGIFLAGGRCGHTLHTPCCDSQSSLSPLCCQFSLSLVDFSDYGALLIALLPTGMIHGSGRIGSFHRFARIGLMMVDCR